MEAYFHVGLGFFYLVNSTYDKLDALASSTVQSQSAKCQIEFTSSASLFCSEKLQKSPLATVKKKIIIMNHVILDIIQEVLNMYVIHQIQLYYKKT